MPAVTEGQFQRIVEMQIAKVKATIIAAHAKSPLIIERYPNGMVFDNDKYMAALSEIYPDPSDIPDVFMSRPRRHIDLNASNSLTASYELQTCAIEEQLNSLDSSNLTNFSLEKISSVRLHGKKMDITLYLDKVPSIFMQLTRDPAAIAALALLLIGASLLSMATLGAAVVGATAVAGSIALMSSAFFATKKPGISGGFSYDPLPETIVEDLMKEEMAAMHAHAHVI